MFTIYLVTSGYNNLPLPLPLPLPPPSHGTLKDIEIVSVALVTTFNNFFNHFVKKRGPLLSLAGVLRI